MEWRPDLSGECHVKEKELTYLDKKETKGIECVHFGWPHPK